MQLYQLAWLLAIIVAIAPDGLNAGHEHNLVGTLSDDGYGASRLSSQYVRTGHQLAVGQTNYQGLEAEDKNNRDSLGAWEIGTNDEQGQRHITNCR